MRRFSLQSRAAKPDHAAWGRTDFSILLIEDNPADVHLVREALEEHGVQGDLTVVTDGETAIRMIESIDSQPLTCPDLFIIDLNLPRKPGRVVLECLRRSEKCRQAPVVVLTSSDAQQDRDDALRLGVNRYIRKPSRLGDFISLGAAFKAILGACGE